MNPPQPLYLQKKVAEKLGLSAADLASIRQSASLAKTTDWIINGKDVALTRSGLASILQYLAATSSTKRVIEDFADCIAPAALERLRSWRFKFCLLQFSFGCGGDDNNPRPRGSR